MCQICCLTKPRWPVRTSPSSTLSQWGPAAQGICLGISCCHQNNSSHPWMQTAALREDYMGTDGINRKACSRNRKMLPITVSATQKNILVCLISIQEAAWLAKVREHYRNPSVLSRMLCCRAILKHFWQVLPAVPTSSTLLPPGSLYSSGRKMSFKLAFWLRHITLQFPSFLLSQGIRRQHKRAEHTSLQQVPSLPQDPSPVASCLTRYFSANGSNDQRGNTKDELISMSSGLKPF